MDPEKCTDATTLRARRHTRWNLKVCESCPHTSLVHTENRKIFGLNKRHIVLVSNTQSTSHEIIQSFSVVLFASRAWTNIIRVIGVANVATIRRRKIRCGAFIASKFNSGGLPNGKLEVISRIWWVIKVVMEPPLLEGHVAQGDDRPIVIRIRFLGYIEAIHARMIESWQVLKDV